MADAATTTMDETPREGMAEATEQTIAAVTNGDFSALTSYATLHLGPALFTAAIGLGVIFLGYMIAKYISRLVAQPVCKRVDETLGKFIGKMMCSTASCLV